MNLLPRSSGTLRLMGIRLSRRVAALIALLCLLVTPALAATYTDNGNGTVTDPATGLTWMRCSMGQTWTGSTCTGTLSTYTWAQANALTGTVSFAGNSDWRLPNIRELQTIVNRLVRAPAIDSAAFPNAPNTRFWSASADASSSGNAWGVVFLDGNAGNNYGKDFTSFVRLVRAGQSLALLNVARPTSDYIDHADGTVTHTPTGLQWKRCAEGQNWDGSICGGTAGTYTWDAAKLLTITFAGKNDWRMPTQEELLSLVDYTTYSPAINTTIFPATSSTYFWSASADAYIFGQVWYVYFGNGFANDGYAKYNASEVRLVRAGQSVGSSTSTTTSTTTPTTTTTTSSTTTTTAPTTTTTSPTTTTTVGSTTTTTQISGQQSSLNDTGQQAFGNATSNALTAEPIDFPGQDARFGRDAAAKAGQLTKVGAGTKGFDFTKIANNGTVLPANAALGTGATGWACTRDNVTGRMWQANPTATSMTWDQAGAYPGQANAPQLCGFSDWRLPTVTELISIFDFGQLAPPSVDTNYFSFPNTTTLTFWTAVPNPGFTGYSWSVDFGSTGYDTGYGNATTLAVRLVRGGSAYTPAAETTPTADFVDNANGTVTHLKTGLTWMRCALGQTWSTGTCTGTATAYSWKDALSAQFTFTASATYAGRAGWRLPNIKELQSLYEFARTNPTVVAAINTTMFPNMPAHVQGSSASHFWSASANVKVAGDAWTVGFDNGDIQTVPKINTASVRLVNGGYAFDASATGSSSTTTTTTTTSTAATTTTTTSTTTTTTLAGFANTQGNMADARYMHTATLLPSGKVLIAGGWFQIKGAELYDPATGTFTPTGSMSGALGRGDHTATLLPNGKVLVAGGSNPITHQYISNAELYDPATGTFSLTGNMTTTRSTHTATLLPNGKVLIAGGATADSSPTNSAEIYDPATGSFSATGNMTMNRTSHAAVLLKNNKVLIAAGSYYYGYSNTAELYDSATGAFTAISGTMTSSRAWGLSATLMNDGRVLIAGGSNAVFLNSAEIFDPSSNQFSATGAMRDLRRVHTGTLLPDGRVLIAGGQSTDTTRIAGVEIFNPATGVFTAAANMSTARSGHTATLLPNGQVLIAAGASNAGLLNSAELFGTASTGTPMNLVTGWNLVGNGGTAAINVSAFSDASKITTVWKWIANSAKWAFYAPSLVGQALTDYATSKGYDVLGTISGGEGFWVNAKQAGSVSLPSGSAVSVATLGPTLIKGWNLAAIGETVSPKQFCDAQSGGVTTLWAWDATNSAWYFYAPSLDAKGGTALTDYITGKGYLDFDFATASKSLGQGVGFWINKP